MSGRFGNGSNSNGPFWYGSTTNFPGFLYKKNVGVSGRRSTKFNPGGNIACNTSTYSYNKYTPGSSGVGASSIANRRAKNRLASVNCGPNSNCGQFYQYLGRYNYPITQVINTPLTIDHPLPPPPLRPPPLEAPLTGF